MYEVAQILDVREMLDKKEDDSGSKEYLVEWKGWESEKYRTWEPEESLSESNIQEFEKTRSKLSSVKKEPGIEVDEVEMILDVREGTNEKEYLVKWKNRENEEQSCWEPLKNIAISKICNG